MKWGSVSMTRRAQSGMGRCLSPGSPMANSESRSTQRLDGILFDQECLDQSLGFHRQLETSDCFSCRPSYTKVYVVKAGLQSLQDEWCRT